MCSLPAPSSNDMEQYNFGDASIVAVFWSYVDALPGAPVALDEDCNCNEANVHKMQNATSLRR